MSCPPLDTIERRLLNIAFCFILLESLFLLIYTRQILKDSPEYRNLLTLPLNHLFMLQWTWKFQIIKKYIVYARYLYSFFITCVNDNKIRKFAYFNVINTIDGRNNVTPNEFLNWKMSTKIESHLQKYHRQNWPDTSENLSCIGNIQWCPFIKDFGCGQIWWTHLCSFFLN